MRIIRFAELRPSPWKNGGGETREIAVSPAGAGFDAFDWRLSMATVAADGPFSRFDGIDRTLVLLDGAMILSVAGQPDRAMAAGDRADFAGDAASHARVTLGPVRDLNLMVRRGRVRADLRLVGAGDLTTPATGAIHLRAGALTLPDGRALHAGDTALFDRDPPQRWVAGAGAALVVMAIRPA
ncbi:MAG: hypothetical protein RIR62_234 [Pseudomonadota bacterium]|jgi:environmental stress-induced protein Ves